MNKIINISSIIIFLIYILSCSVVVDATKLSNTTTTSPEFLIFAMYNGYFYTVNSTDGSLISEVYSFKNSGHQYIQGILSADGDIVTFVATYDDYNDHLLQYSISQNTYTSISKVEGRCKLVMRLQQFAYDPVHNLAAVVGTTSYSKSNLTINFYDFNQQTMELIPLDIIVDYSTQHYGTMPVGTYDAETGNYYIFYNDKIGNIYIAIYNLPSKKVVEYIHFTGPYIRYPFILYYNGEIFLVNANIYSMITFYQLNTQTYTLKQFLQIKSHYDVIDLTPVAVKDNIVIIAASSEFNQYSFTTLDLATLTTTVSNVKNIDLPQTVPFVAVR